MGDLSFSVPDFGFLTVRNYFKTSHAKGPQDGAGANLKHKADMAVLRCQIIIQNAHDLYNYAKENLTEPSSTRYKSQSVGLKQNLFLRGETSQKQAAKIQANQRKSADTQRRSHRRLQWFKPQHLVSLVLL